MKNNSIRYGRICFLMTLLLGIILIGCETETTTTTLPSTTLAGDNTQVANPASANCINQGYRLEIRADADGNQYGVCISQDGRECDEWKLFRGECTFS